MDEKTKGILLKCARTYFTLKNWSKARREYEPLAAANPDDPFVLEPLALIYQHQGETDLARAMALRTIQAFKAQGHPERAEKVATHFSIPIS
jgi:Flp pilus assembly protein TadD